MMTDVIAQPPPPDPAAPRWDAITESVACPLCGYNLRGLAEPRCPECGYRFDWEPLLDSTKRLHPYLFEHHPERNVRSFVRTMLGGLLPLRFWRLLHPAQPSRPKRLVLYWAVAAFLGFVGVLTEAGRSFYTNARANEETRAAWMRMTYSGYPGVIAEVKAAGGSQAYVDKQFPPTMSGTFFRGWYRGFRMRDALLPPLLYVLWPWLTLSTLMVFRASMRRAKVRTVHVLRCTLYSCDAGIWLVPLAAWATLEWTSMIPRAGPAALLSSFGRPMLLLPVIPALYTAYRLWAAYRLYLRFDHPAATAVASQLIVALLVFAALLG